MRKILHTRMQILRTHTHEITNYVASTNRFGTLEVQLLALGCNVLYGQVMKCHGFRGNPALGCVLIELSNNVPYLF